MSENPFTSEEEEEEAEEQLDEPVETQVVEDTESSAPIPTTDDESGLIRPVDPDKVVQLYDQFDQLKSRLLDNDDLTKIGQNVHVNKSGWRKIATAFNVSVEVEEANVYTDEGIVKCRSKARATASNGKTSTAFGTCASNESNFMMLLTKHPEISDKNNEDVYVIDGKHRVLMPPRAVNEHNVVATAETRAKNRAISDLVGGGEVSAEEMGKAILDLN